MRRVAVLLAVFGLVLAMAAPASAAPPQYVSFEGEAFFDRTGTFTATAGPLCASGTSEDVYYEIVRETPRATFLNVIKEFTCTGDTAPSFSAELDVRIGERVTFFQWEFTSGLTGGGIGWVDRSVAVPNGVYDVYVGILG